jgi:hypothetical protein
VGWQLLPPDIATNISFCDRPYAVEADFKKNFWNRGATKSVEARTKEYEKKWKREGIAIK